MKKIAITVIKFYQRMQESLGPHKLPLLFVSGCRSWPTCSQYTIEVVERDGVVKGLAKGLVRILKCNPLY